MAWYRTGTVTVTNGSATVTGAGTDFVSNTQIGECFLGPDGRVYEIAAVVSSTQLTIIPAYQGSTAGAQAFGIQPTSSFARDLALGVSQLLNGFAAVRDGVGQGLFQPGSVATPAIRNANDQDTGLYWPGTNSVGLVSGGRALLVLGADGMVASGGAPTAGTVIITDQYGAGHLVTLGASYSSGAATLGYGIMPGPAAETSNISSTPGVLSRAAIKLDGTIRFYTGGAQVVPIGQEVAMPEAMRVDMTGSLLVGVSSAANHTIARTGAEGTTILDVTNGANGYVSARFGSVLGPGLGNAGPAALYVGRASNNRSINAAGTINAAGADYAEYMVKAQGCGTIAPGEVCGVDRNCLLTQSFTASVSFVVKSTNPAYVGGDTWATHLPEPPAREEDETDAAYAARRAPWEQQLESARQTVDRIAFAGQVPCNVAAGSFEPGDYIVAGPGPADTIVPVVVKAVDMTFGDYTKRIGKVWRVMDDGRAWIDVQHG